MTGTTEAQFIVGQSQQLINVDWNWFFSSLAQSVAAIVGFIGAFIFAKIIESQSDFKRCVNKINEYLAASEKLRERAGNRYFDWYNKNQRREQLDDIKKGVKELVEGGKEVSSAEGIYFKSDFSIFDNKDKIIGVINKLISEQKEKVGKEKRAGYDLRDFGPIDDRSNLNNKLDEERERINQLICEIKSQTQLNASLLNDIELNPQYSPLINWGLLCISILFYLGVIVPLSSLPVINGLPDASFYPKGTQGIFLWPILIIYLFIIIVIFRVNQGCKFKRGAIKDVDKILELSNIENYSIYFKNMTKNEAEKEKYYNDHACQMALAMPEED
jgi:hypothetical protein